MKLIKPEISFLNEKIENDYIKKIEYCARTCYKSEDKIDYEYNIVKSEEMDDDDKKRAESMKDEMLSLNKSMVFLGSLIARGHTSVLEHYRPIYKVNESLGVRLLIAKRIYNLKYIEITPTTSNRYDGYANVLNVENNIDDNSYYVSGNLRAFYDIKDIARKDKYLKVLYKKLSEDFELLFPDKYVYNSNVKKSKILRFFEFIWDKIYKEEHYIQEVKGRSIEDKLIRSIHEGITVKLITNRGVTHQIVRHRNSSVSQESTRYCNYAKDKFNNELNFIDPETTINMILNGDKKYPTAKMMKMNKDLILLNIHTLYNEANRVYMELMSLGCVPDLARCILPIGIKAEMVITMTAKEWRESFFSLRLTDNVHPDMLNISRPLLTKFKEKYNSLFKDINY
jgi:thymidylate synthase (FAD)